MNTLVHQKVNESEVTDNTIHSFHTNIVPRALMLFLGILALIWVLLPDPVPGLLDDILILTSTAIPLLKKGLGPG